MFPPDGRRGPHGALPLDVVIGYTRRSVFTASDKPHSVNFAAPEWPPSPASLLAIKVFPSILSPSPERQRGGKGHNGRHDGGAEEHQAMPMDNSELEQELRNLREKMTIYEEILKETRRSEERAKQSEERLFRLVGIVVLALVGLNFWYNFKVYETDKRVLQDDLRKSVEQARTSLVKDNNIQIAQRFADLEKTLKDANKEPLQQLQQEINKSQAQSTAYTLEQVADIQLFLHDVEGAVRTGVNLFDRSMEYATNYEAQAVDRLNEAFRIAIQDKKRISDEWLAHVQKKLLERADAKSDPRLLLLGKTVEAYRATIRP